jgi:hypothetical protein
MVERYMHEIGRRHIAALLTGHVGLIETPEGVQPLRMPAGDAHLHDQFSQFAAGMSSGVRGDNVSGYCRAENKPS